MIFPLPLKPKLSWHDSPRRFGANRAKGRKHAGCDLYAPPGTPVMAVADGVVRGFAYFYLGTYALAVEHEDFWMRYGEISKVVASDLANGQTVQEGDKIGEIGDLQGLDVSMLHLEMYCGTASGPLTVPSNPPYMRRSDLMNPTAFLDALVQAEAGDLVVASRGDDVAEWQSRLLSLGYAVSVDGDFGALTTEVTREFQDDLNLPMTGVVDAATRSMMVEALKL